MRTEDCEFELDTVEGVVTFTRQYNVEVDGAYGADADGNRGERAVFVEDDEAVDVCVDGKPLAEYPKEFQDAVNAEIRDYLKKVEPDCSAGEPDWDD